MADGQLQKQRRRRWLAPRHDVDLSTPSSTTQTNSNTTNDNNHNHTTTEQAAHDDGQPHNSTNNNNSSKTIERQLKIGKYPIRDALRYEKIVFAIPAFSIFPHPNETHTTPDRLPQSAREVAECMNNGTMMGFKMNEWNVGHGPTMFEKWKTTALDRNPPRQLYYMIQYSLRFEPYVLASRRNYRGNCCNDGGDHNARNYSDRSLEELPKFWDTFRGYGYNKWTWFTELDVAGYKFAALHRLHVSHLNHPNVVESERRQTSLYNRPRYHAFLRYLKATYGMGSNHTLPNEAMLWKF